MNKVFIIFNPAARGEKSRRLRHFLEHQARANSTLELAPTTGPHDATRLAAAAVRNGASLIVAAGGDGTLNEVVNGVGTSGIPVAMLPLGTVNVFARELRLPLRFEKAWAAIRAGKPRCIDLGVAEAGGQKRYFVQLAGIGFDAWAVRFASWELKKKIGPLAYVVAGWKALSHPLADIEANDARGPAVLVGNGRLYGGTFPLFPKAKLDDGLLDVCVFESKRHFDVIRYGLNALRGAHTGMRGVRYFQTDHLVCQSSAPMPYELDGEDAGDGPVTFTVEKQVLQVIAPA